MAGTSDPFSRVRDLYHFTDIRNLPKIKELGGIYPTAKLNSMGVGYRPGGDQVSLALDVRSGMDSYVHLCFANRHPMAYHVQKRDSDARPIYLRVDRTILYQDGVRFSPGVPYAKGVETVPVKEAVDRELIDYQVLYTYMPWGDPRVQPRRRAAELRNSGSNLRPDELNKGPSR